MKRAEDQAEGEYNGKGLASLSLNKKVFITVRVAGGAGWQGWALAGELPFLSQAAQRMTKRSY